MQQMVQAGFAISPCAPVPHHMARNPVFPESSRTIVWESGGGSFESGRGCATALVKCLFSMISECWVRIGVQMTESDNQVCSQCLNVTLLVGVSTSLSQKPSSA